MDYSIARSLAYGCWVIVDLGRGGGFQLRIDKNWMREKESAREGEHNLTVALSDAALQRMNAVLVHVV